MVFGTVAAAGAGAGPATFDWIVPVAFAVYACALIVTGTLARSRVTTLAGVGAVAMVGLFTAMILNPDRYLVAAAGVALTVFLPGLVLLMAEPRAQE
jgi:amino acid permease